MKSSKIEKHLQNAIHQITPDIFEKVASVYVKPMESEDFIMKNNTKTTPVQKRLILAFSTIAIALCLLVGSITFSVNNKMNSVISLDVNPSIEIVANQADKVIQVKALNDDAKKILAEMKLERVDIDVAINAIMGSMIKNGYIDEAKNAILVSVLNKDPKKTQALENKIETDIDTTLANSNIEANVVKQNANNDKSIAKQAEENGISANKMAFIRNIMKKDSSLTLEQLLPLNISQLMQLIRDKKLDISDATSNASKNEESSISNSSSKQKNDKIDKDDDNDSDDNDDSKASKPEKSSNSEKASKPEQANQNSDQKNRNQSSSNTSFNSTNDSSSKEPNRANDKAKNNKSTSQNHGNNNDTEDDN